MKDLLGLIGVGLLILSVWALLIYGIFKLWIYANEKDDIEFHEWEEN